MAILSLSEFAESMGMPYNTVKVNAQRGKIIKGTDGKIDTENPTNKLFFNKQTSNLGTIITKKDVSIKEKKTVERVSGLTESQKQYTDLDLRTRIATAELKERENEIKKIQLEKAAGNLLPVDLVESILVINIQAIFKVFESELENLASIYNEVFGGTRKELAVIIEKQRGILAKAIDKSSEDAKAEIDIAVSDYQDVRSRGERKL